MCIQFVFVVAPDSAMHRTAQRGHYKRPLAGRFFFNKFLKPNARPTRTHASFPSGAHPMPSPILYSFRRCPYAMRARLALLVSGLAYEHREVVLKNKPASMLALSPKGTVPVLWLPAATD